MKTDKNGVSTTAPGAEKFETFQAAGKEFVQYDYRDPDGLLFSTVEETLEGARKKRDQWLIDNNLSV